MRVVNLLLMAFFAIVSFSVSANEDGELRISRTKIVVIADEANKRYYEVHIQVPRNYTGDKQYPVVYMTDSPFTFHIAAGAVFFPVNKML